MLNFVEISRYEKYLKSHSAFCNISKPDYSYKSSLLKTSIINQLSTILRHEYYNIKLDSLSSYFTGEFIPFCFSRDILDTWFDSLAHEFGYCAIIESKRILHACYSRFSRLRFRISTILGYTDTKPFFITLTFTNKVLNNTNSLTRRRYVTRFLKSISNNRYVANIDFGKKNGREHYHAVISCDYINSKLWKYGALNFEHIYNESEKDSLLLSKYVAKLGNHAIKETTKRNSLIYPKN